MNELGVQKEVRTQIMSPFLVKTGELWGSIFALGSVATVKHLYSR